MKQIRLCSSTPESRRRQNTKEWDYAPVKPDTGLEETEQLTEKGCFRSPLDGTHALFDQQDHLGAPLSLPDILRRQVWDIGRVYEIRLDVGVDAQEDD